MKKLIALATVTVLLIGYSSCRKKEESTAITPDYSATGNPNPGAQTVTGATSYSNPATKNSSILVGNSGWSNLTCPSTSSSTLRGSDGSSEVVLNFSGAATTGVYAIALTPAAGACAMTLKNAPNQPAGIPWYAKSGNVTVSVTPSSINAYFSNIVCTQQSFNFPTVNATGTLSCSN
jgi:hypothetical protein